MGSWSEEWDEWIDKQIPVVSAMLRQTFSRYGRDLDDGLLTGTVEQILLEDVANNMIHRRLQAPDAVMPTSADYSSLSSSAGPYSFSLTTTGSSGSFYIKRDELKKLGLPLLATGGIDFHYFKPEVPHVFS